MDHTCHSQVFSSLTGLLTLSESIAKVPNRQVTKRASRLLLILILILILILLEATTKMTEAIAKREEAAFTMEYCTHTRAFS